MWGGWKMNTRKIVDVISEKCKHAPDRVEDYHEALLDAVTEIIWKERQHVTQATQIQKEVTDSCEALGDFIDRNLK